MDKRDEVMQRSMPSIMVPRFGALEANSSNGERLLIASNGVFLEVTRTWATFVRQVGDKINTPLPYGEVQPSTQWKIDPIPVHLLKQFNAYACERCDVEVGASIIWNEANGYRIATVETIGASSSHLNYERPKMDSNEHLIIDCHSHAHHGAFFSGTDNQDDAYCVKLAYVVGNCGESVQSTKMRLCIKGLFEKTNLEIQ